MAWTSSQAEVGCPKQILVSVDTMMRGSTQKCGCGDISFSHSYSEAVAYNPVCSRATQCVHGLEKPTLKVCKRSCLWNSTNVKHHCILVQAIMGIGI